MLISLFPFSTDQSSPATSTSSSSNNHMRRGGRHHGQQQLQPHGRHQRQQRHQHQHHRHHKHHGVHGHQVHIHPTAMAIAALEVSGYSPANPSSTQDHKKLSESSAAKLSEHNRQLDLHLAAISRIQQR